MRHCVHIKTRALEANTIIDGDIIIEYAIVCNYCAIVRVRRGKQSANARESGGGEGVNCPGAARDH